MALQPMFIRGWKQLSAYEYVYKVKWRIDYRRHESDKGKLQRRLQ